jgi:hypothetical protein
MLSYNSTLARHVQSLTVTVDMHDETEKPKKAMTICQALVGAIANMDVLQSFEWISEEIPSYDGVWTVLRLSCPQLSHLTISLGLELPRKDSEVRLNLVTIDVTINSLRTLQLYQFNGLRSFDLRFTPSFSERYVGEENYIRGTY